jgi:hypothetical protein
LCLAPGQFFGPGRAWLPICGVSHERKGSARNSLAMTCRPHAALKRRDNVFLYPSNHFTISINEPNAVGFSCQMEKLNDQAEISVGGTDRRSNARESRHSSRESCKLAAPRSRRQCEYHARSPVYWRRGPFSRIQRPRCVGPLGHLLWTHASLNSMTSSPPAAVVREVSLLKATIASA